MAAQLSKALEFARMEIHKYDPSKTRCLTLASGGTLAMEPFIKKFQQAIMPEVGKFLEVFKATQDLKEFTKMMRDHCKSGGTLFEKRTIVSEIPDHYTALKLNIDESHVGRETKFFMTTEKERVSVVSGNVWLKVMRINEEDAVAMARKVIPEYQPRAEAGIIGKAHLSEETVGVYNSYIPPLWNDFEEKVPDQLPKLFERLVNHLIPMREEREFFYSWLHDSLFDRAYVYLILCGHGGIGKNVMKKVLRALHGHHNSVDGKRSTLVEKFNSQLADSTLAWFDELTYDLAMENVMKEIPNDTMSIERKGVDATRSTKVHASLVISNNKPRDNYIAFDSRKFVPLVLTSKRLESSMTGAEISQLVKKVEDWTSDEFDRKFLKQIATWLKKHGRAKRWPTLEYKGPMFYKLAHTSMSRWQKRAAQLVIDAKPGGRAVFDPKKGFLWSSVSEGYMRKSPDRSVQFPDYSSVKYFFEVFVDAEGKKAFSTEGVPKNIMGDFWVKLLKKDMHIMSEAEVAKEMGGKYVAEKEGKTNGKDKKETGKKKLQKSQYSELL